MSRILNSHKKGVVLTIVILITVGIILSNCVGSKQKTEKENPPESCPQFAKDTLAEIITIDPGNNNCLNCHQGIDPIRAPESGMMQEIYKVASLSGFKDNDCIVCHGGNPEANNKQLAHQGSIPYFKDHPGPKDFYPDPGSPWININTCGPCHEEQVTTQFTSLMFTEAGKIQGTTWGFGGLQGYEHNVANIPVKEVEEHKRLGSEIYKRYMAELKSAEPHIYPKEMFGLPNAPNGEQIEDNPELSVYTYLRTECQRCHIGVKGQDADGDFRGMGCSSCHIPYSNKGIYEGGDPTISTQPGGHLLVHSIQGTRDAKVTVHDKTYSGIPTKTCTACHNRGRRIGVSYEGLMETSYSSPFMSNGGGQSKIHKKQYIHLQPDVHLTKGMMCQDCHTSGDVHSYGDLSGAIQGAVEIECQDCHGTPEMYPWELPIGYGDEIVGEAPKKGDPRGVTFSIPQYLTYGSTNECKDGYLITTRGNPMPHLVRDGNNVILYSASGKNITLKPLKLLTLEDKLSKEGKVAMVQTKSHMDKMECYACHATWAPQCYGCHIKIDYSEEVEKMDWVSVANNPQANGLTPDALDNSEIQGIKKYLTGGEVKEQRSYLRWEDPPLVVNGDHRISPAIPGCQTTVTIIDQNGQTRLLNHIFRIPHSEGAGSNGQLAIDMAPLQPHTTQKKARSCESCHNNPKTMGYGIEGGVLYYNPSEDYVMDLLDSEGNVIAENVDTHFNAIPNLTMDWSRFLDESGQQLQTVGHHFSGSRPLNKQELMKLDRRGVCLSCHQTVPDNDIAVDLMSHVAQYSNTNIDNKVHSRILNKSIRVTSWAQLILFLIASFGIAYLVYRLIRKRK